MPERFVRPLVTLTIEPWLYAQKDEGAMKVAQPIIQQKRATITMTWTTVKEVDGKLVEQAEQSTYTQTKYINRDGIVKVGQTEPHK